MLRWIRTLISYSSLALALASLSVAIERRTDETAVVGNVCGPATNEDCIERRLAGGFPFAYLYDRPSISVPGAIHLGEDEFRPLPFFLDYLLYLAILLGITKFVPGLKRWRAGGTEGEASGAASAGSPSGTVSR